jgi:hypothetical protein
VWKELESKETMILKGWEKIGLTRAWSGDFQLATWKQTQLPFYLQQHLTLKKTWTLMKFASIQQ